MDEWGGSERTNNVHLSGNMLSTPASLSNDIYLYIKKLKKSEENKYEMERLVMRSDARCYGRKVWGVGVDMDVVGLAVIGRSKRRIYLHLRAARRSKRRMRLVHSPFHSMTMERVFNSIPGLRMAEYLLLSSDPPRIK